MQWLLDNWIWILLGGGVIAMHLFGHGGHGKKRHEAASAEPKSEATPPAADSAEKEKQRDL